MNKFIELLVKYLGIPLLRKVGEWILSYIKDYFEERRIKKEQKAKERAIENAKTPEQTRAAHRNNKL